jgi:hypothetical protein
MTTLVAADLLQLLLDNDNQTTLGGTAATSG